MNWKRFDFLRRDIGPVELDLVESYAKRRISRRDFVKRGTIVGLSAPFMGAVIAACGSDEESGGGDGAGGDTTTTTAGGGGTPTQGGNLILANQVGDSASGLDPVNMLDLGTYNVIAQSFEFLVGLGPDGNIAPAGASTGLATDWSPNEDGSVWTFTLRQGVQWQDGGELTSADVAATMDRLVVQGNAGLAGVIGEGSVDASDPGTAVITLLAPNGNFPVLVSIFNAQSVITPADYVDGTTLDERPTGTGPWKLDSFDPTTFVVRFVRNENWWGGSTILDSIELRGFNDLGTAVTAMSAREIDAMQSFTVIGGEGLLNDPNFTVLTPPSAAHRKLWFNVQQGNEFTDPRVRQALAYTIDRDQLINTLYAGRAVLANDHPVLDSLPFFPEGAVEQRSRDIERARSLMAEAGVDSVSAEINTGDIGEIPQMAAIIAQTAAEAGFNLTVREQSNSTFYGDAWCPGPAEGDETLPCNNSASIGIVDWGHRPVPDIYLTSGFQTGGVWNAANYNSADYDAAVSEYQSAVDVEGQKTALTKVVQQLHEDTPACFTSFWNYLSGHDNSVSGIQATALGHTLLSGASKSA